MIYISFNTTSHDIQFGFFRVTDEGMISEENELQHEGLEDVFALTKIDSFPNPVKVTYIAKTPGLYKVLWSNEHSWLTGKTLKYRVSVLRPVIEGGDDKQVLDMGQSSGPELIGLGSSSFNKKKKHMATISSGL